MAAAASALTLNAGVPVHYGFSAQINAPMSDLHDDIDGKAGVGSSFQVSFETSDCVIIRPRVDVGYQFNLIVGLEWHTVGSKYDGPKDSGFSPSTAGVPKGSKTAIVSQVAVICRW